MEKRINKILELQNEIIRLREEQIKSDINKYQYLVGKYIQPSATSVEQILKIREVTQYDVKYDCLSIYIDRGKIQISNDSWGEIDIKTLDSDRVRFINSQEFYNKLNQAIEVFKVKLK
jgi:hypothetical protein